MENKRKELTEEQKKAKLKAYSKAWRESNREALKIKRKTYRKANKEAIATREKIYQKVNREALKIQKKAYYQDNKESIITKNKAYNEANKDKKKAYDEANKETIAINRKANYESRRLPHHAVYCLPHYNRHGYIKYAGVTDNPFYRMKTHKRDGNNTEDWFTLQVCNTRKEAEEVEAEYHEKGYAGKKGYKK